MFRRSIAILVLGIGLGCLATASAEAPRVAPPSHPALAAAELPPLIPAETFFSSAREAWGHRISPDGEKLLWIALKDGKPAIHFRRLESEAVESIPAERAVRWAYWAADSRHITAWWDENGDENYHFLLADTENPDRPIRDTTPYAGVKVRFQQYFPERPLLVVQGANDVRVVREHSDRIVEAARKKGLDVDYIVFDDEGHAIRNWRNRMLLARAVEQFLAKHLGGRAELKE